MSQQPALFRSSIMSVRPEWIDANSHLNMAYYNVLMDQAGDEAFQSMGFGVDYIRERGLSTFSADYRMRYIRELHKDDPVYVTTQILDLTDRSFHFAQELFHADGWLSARGEGVGLHVDLSGPRVVPMPEDVAARIRAVQAAHATLPRPDWVGQPMGLRH
ncbi:MAG: thioesterase family protein [Marinibacterium sp.]|nr:thioesterase family protein [Marinibacterium sp.]